MKIFRKYVVYRVLVKDLFVRVASRAIGILPRFVARSSSGCGPKQVPAKQPGSKDNENQQNAWNRQIPEQKADMNNLYILQGEDDNQ